MRTSGRSKFEVEAPGENITSFISVPDGSLCDGTALVVSHVDPDSGDASDSFDVVVRGVNDE